MPAPAVPRIKTQTQLDNHSVEVQTKANRAYTIWYDLTQYDYTGVVGTYPVPDFDWPIPTSQKRIAYSSSSGEMSYNSVPYSGLNTSDKQQFWQWIDKFIVACMKNYDKTYGL